MKALHFSLLFIVLFLAADLSGQIATPTHDDIWIPMRDGDSLQADVYIPLGVDSSEVILIQTPYDKDGFENTGLPMGVLGNVDAQPYIWVIVDWRGFYGSVNAAKASPDRGEDAYDVCDWIVSQTWHKDRIGTWGPSALGQVQIRLAAEHHPNHTCAVPLVATGYQGYDSYFTGGVLEKARLEQLDALGYGLSPTIYANPYHNGTWQFAENTTWFPSSLEIPTLQIAGWYDHHVDKMMDFYKDSRNLADASVKDEQYLLVGPWVHGGTGTAYVGSSMQGELTYPDAEFKSDTMAWDFLNYYLLDSNNNWQNTPNLTYYEMGGTAGWQTSNADDVADAGSNELFLSSIGELSAANGIGSITFRSNPKNPSPTIGGATLNASLDQGPYDQVALNSRSDVVSFETEDLEQDVTVTGRIHASLYVSADQEDCDIAVRLVDVYPDDREMLITDGIKRMRFRNGYTQADEEFMTAGAVYNIDVDLPYTCYTWQAGHRIKIFISGNNATRYDVNLQNGDAMYTAGDTNVANIKIHHTASYPSKLVLPGSNPVLTLDEEPVPTSFELYPNPVLNQLSIAGAESFHHYQIVNAQGSVVADAVLQQSTISMTDLAPGIYFLNLQDRDGMMRSRKFVKQ